LGEITIGGRIAVIDYDTTNECYYPPVDLDASEILIANGLDPSEADPHFHQQMVYAIASETIRYFERALGRVDFSNLFINLSETHYATIPDAKAHGAATVNYGLFLNTIVNFVIVAFAIFLLLRMVNRWLLKPAPATAPATRDCPQCLMAIPIGAKKCGHCTSAV